VGELQGDRQVLPVRLDPEAIAAMRDMRVSWLAAADESRDGLVDWSTDLDPTLVRHLMFCWFNVSHLVMNGYLASPSPDALPFGDMLVSALLDGLESGGGVDAMLASRLRRNWPDLAKAGSLTNL
jgi:hypothetical protein